MNPNAKWKPIIKLSFCGVAENTSFPGCLIRLSITEEENRGPHKEEETE